MTQFLILSSVRMVLLHYLFFVSARRVIPEPFKRRAFSVVLALILAAILDGMTPDGWEHEYLFGHPFFFYLFANTPAALTILIIALLFLDNGAEASPSKKRKRLNMAPTKSKKGTTKLSTNHLRGSQAEVQGAIGTSGAELV